MVKTIVPLLEEIPHEHYCEPFGGGASVLLAKRPPGGVETYNDLDGALFDLFSVLSDPELFAAFYERVRVLPHHRRFYNEYRETWRQEPDRVARVAKWFLVARQSFSGAFGASWGSAVGYTSRGMAGTTSMWLGAIEMLPAIHARLQRVQIENADWRTILERYDTPDTLFYLDPPYVASTRRSGGYDHEMTDADHAEMVGALLELQGKAVVSGYPNLLYAPLEGAGWRVEHTQTVCSAAARTRNTGIQGKGSATAKQPRTECLWLSPGAIIEPRLF